MTTIFVDKEGIHVDTKVGVGGDSGFRYSRCKIDPWTLSSHKLIGNVCNEKDELVKQYCLGVVIGGNLTAANEAIMRAQLELHKHYPKDCTLYSLLANWTVMKPDNDFTIVLLGGDLETGQLQSVWEFSLRNPVRNWCMWDSDRDVYYDVLTDRGAVNSFMNYEDKNGNYIAAETMEIYHRVYPADCSNDYHSFKFGETAYTYHPSTAETIKAVDDMIFRKYLKHLTAGVNKDEASTPVSGDK